MERQWLSIGLALALLGLVASWLHLYPSPLRRLSLAVGGFFSAYAVWVAASCLWATSLRHAWLEAGRTFVFLLFFCLALLYLSDHHARRAFRYLLLFAAFCLWAACLLNLWAKTDLSLLFFGHRFAYPTTYPNNSAALFLLPFWPLLWLAAGSEERAPLRGVALGLATGLLGLAFLTQSRGAFWSLAITVVIAFAFSPARLRLFFYLLVPSLLMLYAFPNLNRYWLEGPQELGGDPAGQTLAIITVAAALAGTALAFAERRLHVEHAVRWSKALVGGVILIGVAAALVYGSVVVADRSGGLGNWISQTWRQFTEQESVEFSDENGESATRFLAVSSNGRIDIWRVAFAEFKENPLLGVGADNFVFRYEQLRTREQSKPKEPHSLPLQILAETGVVGGILAFGGMLLALGGIIWRRFALKGREKKVSKHGWEMALVTAVFYWLIHGSVEWLWQMPGVTLGAFLMLAAALGSAEETVTGATGTRLSIRTRWGGQLRSWLRSRTLPKTKTASHLFRFGLFAVSLALLVGLGLPRLSLALQDSALTLARTDGPGALDRAASAHWLDMTDPGPYFTQSLIAHAAARTAAQSDAAERSGAVLDNLALALHASEQAVEVEPADWSVHYRAGVAALNLLAARQSSSASTLTDDWSALAGSQYPPPGPGTAAGSLATTGERQEIVRRYRNMSQEELGRLAVTHLQEAQVRNPLATVVKEALQLATSLAEGKP